MRFFTQHPALIALAFTFSLSSCFPTRPAITGVTAEQWRSLLESQQGSVVVVNVWATWCKECIESFPAFIEMRARYRERGVEFFTLSLDEVGPDRKVNEIESFLRRQATALSHYLLLETQADSLDLMGISGVPAVLVYRADGNLAYRLEPGELDDGIEPGEIDAAIRSLIPEPLPEPVE